jgi:NADH-quinone oxidoreductase subunit N
MTFSSYIGQFDVISVVSFSTLIVLHSLGAVFVFYGRNWGYATNSGTLINDEMNRFSMLIFLIIIFGCVFFLQTVGDVQWPLNFGQRVDITLFYFILLLCVLLLIQFMISFLKLRVEKEELFCLTLLSLGVFVAVTANNFLILYVSLELVSIITYILITLSSGSVESGLKYAFISIFSSGLLLLGILFMYLFLGIISYNSVVMTASFINFPYQTTAFSLLIVISFLIKLGAFPFFGWLIDVYSSVSYFILAILAMFIKSFYFLIFLKLLVEVLYIDEFIKTLLFICGILTSVVGILGAIWQPRIKSFIAYSGMSFIGLTLICLGSLNIFVIQSVLLYLFIYIILVFNLIFIILSINNKNSFNHFEDLNHLLIYNPFVTFSLSTCVLSLLGLPPFAGFIAKLALFSSLFFNLMLLSAVLLLILGSFSAFYYLKLLRFSLFFNDYLSKDLNYEIKPFRVISNKDKFYQGLLIVFNSFFVVFLNYIVINYV